MRMTKTENAIFFTCSLIEYIGRGTKNTRSDVVAFLSGNYIQKIVNLSDVYHCENIDKVRSEFIELASIPTGTFDNIDQCLYSIPSYWDIGKVYTRLVYRKVQEENIPESDLGNIIFQVFCSGISDKIQDYNTAWYYSNPDELFFELKKEKL